LIEKNLGLSLKGPDSHLFATTPLYDLDSGVDTARAVFRARRKFQAPGKHHYVARQGVVTLMLHSMFRPFKAQIRLT
jgi:hypothetical protein